MDNLQIEINALRIDVLRDKIDHLQNSIRRYNVVRNWAIAFLIVSCLISIFWCGSTAVAWTAQQSSASLSSVETLSAQLPTYMVYSAISVVESVLLGWLVGHCIQRVEERRQKIAHIKIDIKEIRRSMAVQSEEK
jgi:predicted acyltransferase